MNARILAAGIGVGSMIATLASAGWAQTADPDVAETPEAYKVPYILLEQARAVRSARASGAGDVSAMSTSLAPTRSEGMIEIVIHAQRPLSAKQEAQLRGLGAEIEAALDIPPELGLRPIGQVQAWVPADQLAALAALDWVVAVTPVDPGITHAVGSGSIVSEGVAITRARGAQRHGVTGRGITVGVMSDGVDSLAEAQARGELPANIEVLSPGKGDEGTAMLEIVRDMAPGADLVFSAGTGGTPAYVNALIALSGSVDIIAEDVGLPTEPKFQQGVAAAVADALAATGIGVYSAAGNSGESHVRNVIAVGTGRGPDGHDGPFTDCEVPPLNTVDFKDGDNTVDVEFDGGGNPIILQWSEPRAIFPTELAGAFTDLDLYLLDETGTVCLDQSLGLQGNGHGDPFEFLIPPVDLSRGKIVVNVRSVTSPDTPPPMIDLNLFESATILDEELIGRASSLDPDSNYVGEASNIVALDATTRRIGTYNSAGPILLGLTTDIDDDFQPVAGAGVTRSPGVTATGVDNVSVSGVGGFGEGDCPATRRGQCRFPGTSAAAPQAAGCAALVREARGLTDTAEVRTLLIDTARDLGERRRIGGAGLLDCRAAAGLP